MLQPRRFSSLGQNGLTKVPAVPQLSQKDTQPKMACVSPGTIMNDSLIAQEKDGGDGTGKIMDGEERERKRVTSIPHFIASCFIELHRCCIFFFMN